MTTPRFPIFKQELRILDLDRRREKGMLDLHRAFRSQLVWSRDAQSRLIESVLLRIPIPPLYVAEALDGRTRVIDGLQRLDSLFRFLSGELVLEGLRLLPELDGKRFRGLENKVRRRYEDTPLTVMILAANADPILAVDLFDRMNLWKPLRADEVRRFCDDLGSERSG